MAGACATAVAIHLAAHRLRAARDADRCAASPSGLVSSSAWVRCSNASVPMSAAVTSARLRRDSRDRRSARPARSSAQASKQLLPILRSFRAQGEGVIFVGGANCWPRRATRQRAPAARSCVASRSPSPEASAKMSHDFLRGRLRRDAAGGRSGRSLPGFAREQADLAFATGWTNQARQRSRLAEAGSSQHALPLRALQQRLVRAQIAIGETPPAAGEAEDRFRPELRRGHVHEDEACRPARAGRGDGRASRARR